MRTDTSERKEATDYDRRMIRAATESMTVSPAGRGRFDVYNVEGRRYDVSLVAGTCSCPDFERRGTSLPHGCKHIQRVELEAGIREIPAELAGRRTDAELAREVRARRRSSAARADSDRADLEPVAIADGGRIIRAKPRESDTKETGARPSGCSCLPSFEDLPCFPCYLAGFRTPNPTPSEE